MQPLINGYNQYLLYYNVHETAKLQFCCSHMLLLDNDRDRLG